MTTNNSVNNTVEENDFSVNRSLAGTSVVSTISHTDNTNAASHAVLDLVTGGASGGDPYVHFNTGVTEYSFGPDNTDSDILKLTDGATPSAGNELITVDSSANGNFLLTPNGTGRVVIGDGTPAAQGGSNLHRLTVVDSQAGGVVTLEVNNNDNTNTGSHAQLNLYVGGTSGGNPSIFFNIPSGTDWGIGPDNASSDSFEIVTGGNPTTGTTVVNITTAGEVTMPLQPAFLAYQPSIATNVTGDGTVWQLGTVNLTEIYDQNSDFNVNGTFTASVTGRYSFNAIIQFIELGAAHVTDNIYLTTSNRTYYLSVANPYAESSGAALVRTYSADSDMDAGDTATISLFVAGGTKTVDIFGRATGDDRTFFSGKLEC